MGESVPLAHLVGGRGRSCGAVLCACNRSEHRCRRSFRVRLSARIYQRPKLRPMINNHRVLRSKIERRVAGDVADWHNSEVTNEASDFRLGGQSGLSASVARTAALDPLPPSAIQSSCVAVFLFDQLVRAQQDRCRHIEAKRLGGRHIEHGLVFHRHLQGRSASFSLLRMRST